MSNAKRTADVMGDEFFTFKSKKFQHCMQISVSKCTPDQKQELFDWCEAELSEFR